MWYNQPQIKILQSQWYKILKSKGFEDIEQTTHPDKPLKAWHSMYFKSRHSADKIDEQLEYFTQCDRYLHLYQFESEHQRLLWELHAQGLSLRAIAKQLEAKGFRTNKDYVCRDINKHKSNMHKVL